MDPGDVLGDGCWETVKRVFAMMSTLWVGCISALIALYMAEVVGAIWAGAWSDVGDIILDMGSSVLLAMVWAPLYYLFSFWGLIMIPLLIYVMFMMFRADMEVTKVWFVIVLIAGVIAMNGMIEVPANYALAAVAWVVFLFVMISLAAGCWFLRGWERNSQAQHLQEVSAENELRRIEIEQAYGTKSFGQNNQTDYRED
ncbi:MAG: hypothetical protein AB8F34_16300 [Akkermansiaceae bacterium]